VGRKIVNSGYPIQDFVEIDLLLGTKQN